MNWTQRRGNEQQMFYWTKAKSSGKIDVSTNVQMNKKKSKILPFAHKEKKLVRMKNIFFGHVHLR